MFSFHKPKIYRSNNGCCICKAKSSSSRFTDSKKYETEFERCFLIKELRSGEICNACVLLVKRCKKLPKETTKHWAHVVDARAGPGTKSLKITKNNTKNNNLAKISSKDKQDIVRKVCERRSLGVEECDCANCEHSRRIECDVEVRKSARQAQNNKKSFTPKKFCAGSASNSSSGNSSESNDEEEDYMSDYEHKGSSRMRTRQRSHSSSSVTKSDSKSNINDQPAATTGGGRSMAKLQKNKSKPGKLAAWQHNESTFLDMNFWRQEQICCGVIFRNSHTNMVLIDAKQFKPCACRTSSLNQQSSLNQNSAVKSDEPKLKRSSLDPVEAEKPSAFNLFKDKQNIAILEEDLDCVDSGIGCELSIGSDVGSGSIGSGPAVSELTCTIGSDMISSLGSVTESSHHGSEISSGISSASSDVCSLTTEEEEDSNASLSTIHSPLQQNAPRTFGAL